MHSLHLAHEVNEYCEDYMCPSVFHLPDHMIDLDEIWYGRTTLKFVR